MNKIAAIFKSKNILLALALAVLIFLVIFLGSLLRITWFMRMVIIVIIFLVLIILILFKKVKDAQKAGQIEQSINNTSDQMILSPEKRAEIDQFKKQLEAAISALKNSKLGRGRSGKTALYSLPWYMIIGPAAAGKTTAIQNSGLEFPYGKDSLKGIGGTRNCDWFFSTSAIFLDTAGRYFSEKEDRPEWIAFLETLKKYRYKKPINGVIVALNIDEIIRCDNNQLKEHAKNIRIRIDELIEHLGIVFPVYIIFTKCDLIQGFVEYFGDFSETERSQIWGATIDVSQQKASDAKTIFQSEFTQLAEVIHKAKMIRLSNPLKREQRRKVFLFPFQFQSLKEKLTFLIGEVFLPNPYQDNPIFRGFYFTSGTQEGSPLDLAIREIAKRFNLPPVMGEESEEIIETKNYFIKDMLNDVVIADQNFAIGQASNIVKQYRLARLITISTTAVLFFILTLMIILAYTGSSNTLENISSSVKSFSKLKLNWEGDILNNLTKTESLRNMIQRAKRGELNESFITLCLDKSDQTIDEMTSLYLSNTKPFFDMYIHKEIEKTLSRYSDGYEYSNEQIYNYLKAYLLIGNERSKLDNINKKFLSEMFVGILYSKFIDTNTNASIKEKDSLKILFNKYISFILDLLQDKKIYPDLNTNYLINDVRLKFSNKPNAVTIYARMKANGISQYVDLTFDELINGKSEQIINTDSKIPYIFTPVGLKEYILPKILNESNNPDNEDWVIDRTSTNHDFHKDFDSEKFRGQLTDLYIKDCIQNWLEFINSFKFSVSEFVSVAATTNALKLLSNEEDSPLILIFKKFANQLKALSEISIYSDSTSYVQSILSNNYNDINRFRKFIVGSEDGSVPAALNIVINQYVNLYNNLEDIKDEPDLNKDIIKKASIDFQNANKVILNAVNYVPEFQRILIEPLKLSLQSVGSETFRNLNEKWKLKVVDKFNNTLKHTYPFSEDGNDASIQDFEDFFKPEGILWSFFNNELNSLIDKENWKPYKSENGEIGFSKEFLNSLKRADEIRKIFFKDGTLNLSFWLKPLFPVSKIEGENSNLREQFLKIDGIGEIYRMGGISDESYFIWPNKKGISNVVLSITHSKYGIDELRFSGDWAIFKLFDKASISKVEASSKLILKWNFRKPNLYDIDISYLLDAKSSKNPFLINYFKSFSLPDKIN